MDVAVTLKDIAKEMGVTVTTVHKALNGKPGISEQKRAEIEKAAIKMGYKANYMAASLKRKGPLIAIAMPDATFENRYYFRSLWHGVSYFFEDVREFDVSPLEYTYPNNRGANGAALKEIYEKHADDLSGLLTMAEDSSQSSYFIEKLADKGIPIVFVGSDLYKDKRFCCVKTYDEMAGSMAAELLAGFNTDESPRQVIVTGYYSQLGMRDQYFNVAGFDQFLAAHAPYIGVIHIQGENRLLVQSQIKAALTGSNDIWAMYSTSARFTIMMAEAVSELGLEGKLKLIGNDLFEESFELLKSGKLSAIIDKKIKRQSYLAMKILFNHIVKHEYPANGVIYVKPEIILQSSVANDALYMDRLSTSEDPLQ
jgi:LacI family transcriptional regulator